MLLIMAITKCMDVMAYFFIGFAIWSFLGYIFRWKHIYCSYQNTHKMPMTPDRVNWYAVNKFEAYIVPATFLVLGIILLWVL